MNRPMKRLHPSRRQFVAIGAAAGASAVFPRPLLAQGAQPKIVVIGGGFAGLTAARMVKRYDGKLDVTVVEANPTYTACPFSNDVIAGLRDIKEQQFGYGKVGGGVTLAQETATGVDATARIVTLGNGSKLSYDRLVLAPGIELRFDALPGYTEAAAERMPHAWKAGEQTLLLRRQLEAMNDGGVVGIVAPQNPYRCPPGPYERASLIAWYLKTKKPRSKVIILDAKDAFSKQRLFQDAWKQMYPNLEWVSLSMGGKVASVDPATNTLATDFDKHKVDVANVIPPQKAGRIAEIAGATDRSGWCPTDPMTFESRQVPNIHVVGDAAIAGAMPKSAFAANCAGQSVRCGGRETCARREAGDAEAHQHLLQPDRARLRHLGRRHLPPRERPAGRSRGLRGRQSRQRAVEAAKRRSKARRCLVQHHHFRGLRLSGAQCGPLQPPLRSLSLAQWPAPRRACGPTPWSETPFRNRSPGCPATPPAARPS